MHPKKKTKMEFEKVEVHRVDNIDHYQSLEVSKFGSTYFIELANDQQELDI